MILLDTALSAGVGTPDTVVFPSWLLQSIYGVVGSMALAIIGLWRYIVANNKRVISVSEKAVEVMTKAVLSMDRLAETVVNQHEDTKELIKDFRDELRRTA